jgi:hypothetical protein
MKRAAIAIAALLLQATSSFAEAVGRDMVNDLPAGELIRANDDHSSRIERPTLNASEIAAIQYHERLSDRCQTPAGVFAIDPLQPVNTTCVVNGQPGFMLP